MQSLIAGAVIFSSCLLRILLGTWQEPCPPKDDAILTFPALSKNPETGELIGVDAVRDSFQKAKDRMSQMQQQLPSCCAFLAVGHWQSLIVGLTEVLTKDAEGKLQFGIRSNAFKNKLKIKNKGANSDCNTIGIDPDLISGEQPTNEQIAAYWHESQHSHRSNSGAIEDCDHAELCAATLIIMDCLKDCGYGPYNKDDYDGLKKQEKALREKCNH